MPRRSSGAEPSCSTNDDRHPVVLAKELATLDRATEGRLEVGLSAGWKRTDDDEAGIAYDGPIPRRYERNPARMPFQRSGSLRYGA